MRYASVGHHSDITRACGARPSEGCAIQGKMALRGEPGDNAKGGFSEGRGLRVREYGPDASQGVT